MRRTIGAAILSALVAVTAMSLINSSQTSAQPKEAPRKVLRHVVLFKFKEGTTKKQVKAIETAFGVAVVIHANKL